MSTTSQPNYYAIIPASVRYSKELEPSAKLLYGEITALCNQEGYCWAGNQYFQDLYGVDERSIRRWLESLKNSNFIKVEVEKKGFKTRRKIWISEAFQKSFTTGQKCPPRGDKNVRLEGTKMSSIIIQCSNSTSKKKQQQTPDGDVVVFHEFLKKTELTDEEKKSVISYAKRRKLSPEEFQSAVDFVCRPEFEVKDTLVKALMWAIKDKPELPKPIDRKDNFKYAYTAELALESEKWNLEALNKYVAINCKISTNSTEHQIRYDRPNFKIELDKLLNKFEFKKRK